MSAKNHVCVSVHTKEESVPAKSDPTGSIFALPKLIRSVQFKVFRLFPKVFRLQILLENTLFGWD